MERYTYFDGGKWRIKIGDTEYSGDWVDRLAAYEETGPEPEDMKRAFNEDAILKLAGQALGMSPDRLRELAQAEKEGRLVVLPAEKIFELTWDAGPNCDLICPVSINGVGQCDFCENGKLYIYERTCRQEHIEHIGKTVFLTREAAEAALEEREAIQNVLDKQDKG